MGLTERDIERAKGNEPEAFERIYNETIKSAYYVARKFLRNDAEVEDVLQESYIKVYEKIDTYQSGNFQGWVDTIVANRCKDYLKKKNPLLFSELATDDNDDSVVNNIEETNEEFRPDLKTDYEETKRLVLEIIDKLPVDQKMSVILFYYEQMGVKEIAKAMECSENTIKSRLNYARKSIKSEVEKLEKKGTKLYCAPILPFLLWLFREDVKACIVPASFSAENMATKTIVQSTAKNTAKSVAQNVAGQTVAKAGLSVGMKALIGIIAAVVVTGGVIGAVVVSNQSKNEPEAPTQDVQDDNNDDNTSEENQVEKYLGEYYKEGENEESNYQNGGMMIAITKYDGKKISFRVEANSPNAAHVDEFEIVDAQMRDYQVEFEFPATSFGTYGHGMLSFADENELLVSIYIDGNTGDFQWSMTGEEDQIYVKVGTENITESSENTASNQTKSQDEIDKIVADFLKSYKYEESFTTGGYTLNCLPEIGTNYTYFMCGDIPFICIWEKYDEPNQKLEPFFKMQYYYVDTAEGTVKEFKNDPELYGAERPTFYMGSGHAFIARYEAGVFGNNIMVKMENGEFSTSTMSDYEAEVAYNAGWQEIEWKKLNE